VRKYLFFLSKNMAASPAFKQLLVLRATARLPPQPAFFSFFEPREIEVHIRSNPGIWTRLKAAQNPQN
jgi:hypothetical protein